MAIDEFFIAKSNEKFYRECLEQWPPEPVSDDEFALGEWYYSLQIDEAIERQEIFYCADYDMPWKNYYRKSNP
jgi:hypothetical protein